MSASTSHSPTFQTTRWTHVVRLREGTDDAERDRILAQLCRAYWFPLYGYARRSGRAPHDAEDLTQSFFQHALSSDLFAKAQRERGRMRCFLLTAFQHFSRNDHAKDTAVKRGGGQIPVSLDAMQGEERYQCEPQEITTPEDLYNRRWARDFFIAVKERLRLQYADEGKEGNLPGAPALALCGRISRRLWPGGSKPWSNGGELPRHACALPQKLPGSLSRSRG